MYFLLFGRVFNMKTRTETLKPSTATEKVLRSSFLFKSYYLVWMETAVDHNTHTSPLGNFWPTFDWKAAVNSSTQDIGGFPGTDLTKDLSFILRDYLHFISA